MNRDGKIRKMAICGSARLLVFLTALVFLGISSLDQQVLLGGHSDVMAMADHASEGGDDAVAIKMRRTSKQDCGPTNNCLPILLFHGDILHVINLSPDRKIDLPRLTVDLWHIQTTPPIPIV